jgi:5-methylcytosine-specific restriction endonuclease McrA
MSKVLTKEQLEERRAKDRARYQFNCEKKRESVRRYKERNAESIKIKNAEYRKKRKANDPLYKFKESIRKIVLKSFQNKNKTKKNKTTEIIGCDMAYFINHIELLFEPWMNWDNRGSSTTPKTKWEIDHIIPLSIAITEEDVIRLNHYTNLRPLCSKENRDKSNTII